MTADGELYIRGNKALSRVISKFEAMLSTLERSLGNCSAVVWQNLSQLKLEGMLDSILHLLQSKTMPGKFLLQNAKVRTTILALLC
jgi:hypothetical protein